MAAWRRCGSSRGTARVRGRRARRVSVQGGKCRREAVRSRSKPGAARRSCLVRVRVGVRVRVEEGYSVGLRLGWGWGCGVGVVGLGLGLEPGTHAVASEHLKMLGVALLCSGCGEESVESELVSVVSSEH